MPVMMPAPWMASSYMPLAASGESSRNGEPGSISRITRSRGRSFPRDTWRSRRAAGPPSAACARRLRNSSTSAPMRAALARNSSDCVSIVEAMATLPSSMCPPQAGLWRGARANGTGCRISLTTIAGRGKIYPLGPDFLALENHVSDHIEHDRAGDQPDRLRPRDAASFDRTGAARPVSRPWNLRQADWSSDRSSD